MDQLPLSPNQWCFGNGMVSRGSLGLGANFMQSGHFCTKASTSFETPGHQTEEISLR